MSTPKDGGPAFPWMAGDATFTTDNRTVDFKMNLGMSLRDYFAGKALAGMLASPTLRFGIADQVVVKAAYGIADAMLKEREL